MRGLAFQAGAISTSLDATGPQSTMHMPGALSLAYGAQFDRGKLHLAAEYWKTPLYLVINTSSLAFAQLLDPRSWYPMVRYELTKKLQVGAYYSHYVNKAADVSQPLNYSRIGCSPGAMTSTLI